ncbi:hypothetical protein OV090_02670 [Nannocystis sp. RBIL2]|uniref:hypothetical protein n=1 Tax=Nannocystis sp. RBIL2 TaxID=2996788 RepID=UPI00226F8377|nr:hypothetical protein [Nannocystis sp. RBIL2]MCY1063646.1 hypothetical protein [Nannocystis sp. RBIL2]
MIAFSIRSLVVEGQLGGVRPGDTRDIVLERLGPPSERMASGGGTEVWRYGNFELFLDGDLVYTLYHDYLIQLEADGEREIDAWILGDSEAPDYDDVVERLNAEQVPFITGRDREKRRMLAIPGGARLLFEVDEDTGVEAWTMIAVDHPDYSWGKFTPDGSGDGCPRGQVSRGGP